MNNFIYPILIIIVLFIGKYLLLKYNIINSEKTKLLRKTIGFISILVFALFIFLEENYKFQIIHVVILIIMLYGLTKLDKIKT